ncbi:MAG: SDR family oxidoreductase [archaeon]
MRVLIFGASGFLGIKLVEYFSKENIVFGTVQENSSDRMFALDATNLAEIERVICMVQPDLVINTIGVTNSLECEKNPLLAEKVNFQAVKKISEISKKIGAKYVFISSSYVFDGKGDNYTEEDLPNPQTKYGQTKLLAEKEVISNRGIVVRVDLMYGFNGFGKPNGVLDKVLKNSLLEERNPNQKRTPLFIEDLPEIIFTLISKNLQGIFHISGPDKIDMYSFLNLLKESANSSVKIIKINDPHALVRPPQNVTLSTEKIKKLGIKTTSLVDGLSTLKKQIT